MTEMAALRIVHEGERQRRHARYRIAARLQIADASYEVQNWSIDGLCVKGLDPGLPLDSTLRGDLQFDFEVLSVGLRLTARLGWRREDLGLAGFQFVELTERELSTLRYVIDAFLAGDVVSTGDLIHIVGRENFGAARSAPGNQADEVETRSRLVKMGALGALFLAMVVFIGSTVYRRAYTVEASWAAVQAPIVVIRSPQASYFKPIDLVEGRVVDDGDSLALVELLGGGAVAIDSPCRCSIVEVHARERDFVGLGEPLLSLLPEGEPTYVRARVAWEDLEKVAVGDQAEIRLGTGETIGGRVTEIATGSPQALRLSSPLKNEATLDEKLADLVIVPERPLPMTMLDEPVWVSVQRGTAS